MGGCGGSHIGSICISIIILIIVIILLILIGFNMNTNQQSQQFNKSGFEIFETSSDEPVETCFNQNGGKYSSECTTGATKVGGITDST
jgi:FtsZ-interacting cell division protein ZipA